MSVDQKDGTTDKLMAIKEIQLTNGQQSARIDVLFYDFPESYESLLHCGLEHHIECYRESKDHVWVENLLICPDLKDKI